jgi:hypothetical protein
VMLLLDEIEHVTFDISPDPHWRRLPSLLADRLCRRELGQLRADRRPGLAFVRSGARGSATRA